MSDPVRALLDRWADRTARGDRDLILADHDPDAEIFDVLPPLRHHGAAAYRATWDGWQPETAGQMLFRLEELTIRQEGTLAFAHGLLRCGGTLVDGRSFEDLVRATFCLARGDDGWRIVHQHISKPAGAAG